MAVGKSGRARVRHTHRTREVECCKRFGFPPFQRDDDRQPLETGAISTGQRVGDRPMLVPDIA
eukprot:3896583-Rhodomonas_salina.2